MISSIDLAHEWVNPRIKFYTISWSNIKLKNKIAFQRTFHVFYLIHSTEENYSLNPCSQCINTLLLGSKLVAPTTSFILSWSIFHLHLFPLIQMTSYLICHMTSHTFLYMRYLVILLLLSKLKNTEWQNPCLWVIKEWKVLMMTKSFSHLT